MRARPRRLLIVVTSIFLMVWFIKFLKFHKLEWDFDDDENLGHIRNAGLKHDKWIIVTTIHHPTEAVKTLNYLQGWKLLVVGDRTTPKTWNLDGAIYLSPLSQKKLAYKIHPLLPYDSYTRKMVGYLYAIEHGAEYIYETDDDNLPMTGPDAFTLSIGYTDALIVDTPNLTYNHHKHFGQSTTWPRGYPLEYVGLSDMNEYILCETSVPAIQQGLVSGDPDVDAIFRLTRTHNRAIVKLKFDNGAPPVILPKGTFSPMNTQNTLFTAKSFWAMVLPTSVNNRATDIYRAYFAQRLLWLLGDTVGFYPPNSYQKRNPHSALNDAREETELYHNMGHMVRFLHGWSCSKIFFFDCVSQLAHDMVKQGFWGKRDGELVDSWITDLATIGYAPPAMKIRDICNDDDKKIIFYPDEQNTTFPHSSISVLTADLTNHIQVKESIANVCKFPHEIHYGQIINTMSKYENIILVIGITKTDLVPFLEAVHRPYFPHIIYCSGRKLNQRFFDELRLSYISTGHEETTGTSCVATVMRMHYLLDGYLYSSEHMWIGHNNDRLPLTHPNLMWTTVEVDIYSPELVQKCNNNELQCTQISKDLIQQLITSISSFDVELKLKSELRQCLVKIASDPQMVTKPTMLYLSDYSFYLPTRLKDSFNKVKNFFSSRDHQKYDFFTPVLIECLELTVEYLKYSVLNVDQSSDTHYLHAFGFNDLLSNEQSAYKTFFCQHFEKLKHTNK